MKRKKMTWQIKKLANAKIKNPILVEGLPGVGNVGKIAVDFLIDSLKAKKLFEMTSYELPHCVFVNEENMVELPMIDMYYVNLKDRTLLLLAGDIQPLTERSCYEFCHMILDTFEKSKGTEIITLGGIALPQIPQMPQVYATGNTKKIINKYASIVNTNIHGVVGPIIGVSGLLPGLAGKRNIPAVALLAETFGHPHYLGIKSAKEILKVLQRELRVKLDIDQLNEEQQEKEMFRRTPKLKKALFLKKEIPTTGKETTYIG